MKKIISYLFKILILIFLYSNSFADIKYKTYEQLPCKFNNAEVGNSAYPRNEIDKTYKKKFNIK